MFAKEKLIKLFIIMDIREETLYIVRLMYLTVIASISVCILCYSVRQESL